MKAIKRSLTIFITLILVTIFVYNVYNLINIKVLKKDLSPVYGYALLEVVSGSMEPTIHVGDMIIIDTWDTSYHKNDIVTFKDEEGTLITHRIISIDGKKMVTKGDNNDSKDEPYTTDKILGKYVTKISGLGRVLASFKSPLTMVLILFIGILTCMLVSTDKDGNPIIEQEDQEFLDYINEKKKKSNKNDNSKKKSKSSSSKKSKEKDTQKSKTKKSATKNDKEEPKKKSKKEENADKKTPKEKSTKTSSIKKANSKEKEESLKKKTVASKKVSTKNVKSAETKKDKSVSTKKTSTKKDTPTEKKKQSTTKKGSANKKDDVKKTSTRKKNTSSTSKKK